MGGLCKMAYEYLDEEEYRGFKIVDSGHNTAILKNVTGKDKGTHAYLDGWSIGDGGDSDTGDKTLTTKIIFEEIDKLLADGGVYNDIEESQKMKGYAKKIKSLKERVKSSYSEKTNLDVIQMFIEDSFPKDKRQTWGTTNLKITKIDNGWALRNYNTNLLVRDDSGKIRFNPKKYSVSTTKIQNQIKRILDEKGIKYTSNLEEKCEKKESIKPKKEGKKYEVHYNIGKSKYVVNFHDGKKKHDDGSEFYDIEIFKNKRELNNFIADLESKGYKKEYQNSKKEAALPKRKFEHPNGKKVEYSLEKDGMDKDSANKFSLDLEQHDSKKDTKVVKSGDKYAVYVYKESINSKKEGVVNKDGFFLQLVDIEDGNTNVQIQVDNFKNALIVTARSYNKETKKERRTEFRKDVGKKLSLRELEKIKNDFSKMTKISDIKKYISDLKLTKSESLKEKGNAWNNSIDVESAYQYSTQNERKRLLKKVDCDPNDSKYDWDGLDMETKNKLRKLKQSNSESQKTPKWIVFKHNDKVLSKISVDGISPGEIKETKGLLAEEKDIPITEIKVFKEFVVKKGLRESFKPKKSLKEGGGAGINFKIKSKDIEVPSKVYPEVELELVDGKYKITKKNDLDKNAVDVTIDEFSALGYQDGMTNVRGDILKAWLQFEDEEFIRIVEENLSDKPKYVRITLDEIEDDFDETLWAGYVRGKLTKGMTLDDEDIGTYWNIESKNTPEEDYQTEITSEYIQSVMTIEFTEDAVYWYQDVFLNRPDSDNEEDYEIHNEDLRTNWGV
jgi:predicted RNA-binding protein with TRAM domain